MANKLWRGSFEDRLRRVEEAAGVPVEGGEPFEIGLQQGEASNLTLSVLDINEAEMPADFDATSFQATDPTKPALVVVTIEVGVSAVVGTDTQANIGGFMYSAKPLSAHMGDLVTLPISLVGMSVNTEGEDSFSTTATWTERILFVLPVGWWAFLYFGEDNGAISLGACSRFDWSLG